MHTRTQKGGVPEEAEIGRTITRFVFFTCALGAPMSDYLPYSNIANRRGGRQNRRVANPPKSTGPRKTTGPRKSTGLLAIFKAPTNLVAISWCKRIASNHVFMEFTTSRKQSS